MYISLSEVHACIHTVEPPIVDPLRKGHGIIDLSTKDTVH